MGGIVIVSVCVGTLWLDILISVTTLAADFKDLLMFSLAAP